MKQIVAFDFDGTLVDSKDALAAAFNESFHKNNLLRVDKNMIKSLIGVPAKELVQEFYPNLTSRKLNKILEDKQSLLDVTKFKLKPNVNLKLFRLKSKYDLAIVSNAKHQQVIDNLKIVGIDPKLFKAIVAVDDVVNPKPDPEPLKKLADILEQEIVAYIGDIEVDVKTAKAYGTKSIILLGSRNHKEIILENPDIIINDLSELAELL
jgi:HAD superfamily hydrolase (TIGR01549 family)